MKEQTNRKAKVVGIDSKFDEHGKALPTISENSKAEVTYLEEQMPIAVQNNTVEIDLATGTKIRKDVTGKVLSRTELTPEEKAKYAKKAKKEDISR